MSRDYTVERDWRTKAGFRAVVIMTSMGHRCGYVAVAPMHPLYRCEYGNDHDAIISPTDEPIGKRGIIPLICGGMAGSYNRPDCAFDVHGGITYASGSGKYPAPGDELWWFGFDAGHSGDAPAPGSKMALLRSEYGLSMYDGAVHRELDYMVSECESLATQLVTRISRVHWFIQSTKRWFAWLNGNVTVSD